MQRFIPLLLVALLLREGLAQEPKPGGVYRMLSAYDMSTLDPAQVQVFEGWWSSALVLFQHLYQTDTEGKLFPEVAADFPTVSEDGLTYNIPIRQGMKFSNGRDITAEDVAFSLERILSPDTTSFASNTFFIIEGGEDFFSGKADAISGLNVIDDYTLKIKLKQVSYTFPNLLSISATAIVPKQEVLDAGDQWGTSVLIGSGPFMLKEFLPGDKIVYERNPNYYKEGQPYLDGIEIILNVPQSVAPLRVENGEAEFAPADTLPGPFLAQLQTDPKYTETMRVGKSGIITRLTFNAISEPFQDVKVRQAVAHAIDRETLAKRSGRGLPYESFYPEPFPQYDVAFKSNYQYDLEAAKALMEEAGYGPNNRLTGYNIFAGQGQELGEIMQADLAEIYIDAEVLTGNFSDYQEQWWAGEIFMTHFGWGGTFFDASEAARTFRCPSEAQIANAKDPRGPKTRWCDPAFDEAFNKAETLPLDNPERDQIYADLQNKIINEDVWVIIPYASQALALSQANIVGDDLHPLYTLPTLEDAWFNN
ncbi:MAG: ABC transporter substrate-binding protein [Trueperaceae bacterium]